VPPDLRNGTSVESESLPLERTASVSLIVLDIHDVLLTLLI
jgi:hypothetical protein